jgi:hypothetical protein
MAEWSETEAALGEFLERHGEYPQPHYTVAALYHAGLWDLGGPRPVPPAHGNAPLRWFASNQPVGGLPAPVYNLVRYSGEARVAAAAAIVDKYLQDADHDAILADAGLADADIANDEVPAGDVIVVRSRWRRSIVACAGSGAVPTIVAPGLARRESALTFCAWSRRAVLCCCAAKGTARTRAARVSRRTSPMPDGRSWKWTTSRISPRAARTIQSR